jgi:hypothetical protein
MAFGKAQWEKYFGDVGVEPPLPANINEILESPCPFWPNKKVHDTHLLVLIPKYVNGKLLTLNTLQELIQSPQKGGYGTKYSYYYDIAEKEIGSHPVSSSYWALITKDVLLNSRKKTYSEQQSLINSPYVVPNSLEIVTGILMHYAETGERLYSDNPSTYTRCQEMLSNGYRMIISFRSSGLEVCNHGYFSTDNRKDLDGIGCGAMRRF